MACAAKFTWTLPRARVFVSSLSSSSSSIFHLRRFLYEKSAPLKLPPKNLRSMLCNRVSNLKLTFSGADRKFLREFPLRGSQLCKGAIFGGSITLASISLWPNVSFALDDRFTDAHQEDFDALDVGKYETFWKFASRLWVPIIFCLTVLTNLDHSLTVVATKVILFLLSTKPSPLSVYIFVDELCHSSCQDPHLHNQKSLYASKVEVQDYKLLCLARVEIHQQKFILLGILGGWWTLPSLTSAGELNGFINTSLRHYGMFI